MFSETQIKAAQATFWLSVVAGVIIQVLCICNLLDHKAVRQRVIIWVCAIGAMFLVPLCTAGLLYAFFKLYAIVMTFFTTTPLES